MFLATVLHRPGLSPEYKQVWHVIHTSAYLRVLFTIVIIGIIRPPAPPGTVVPEGRMFYLFRHRISELRGQPASTCARVLVTSQLLHSLRQHCITITILYNTIRSVSELILTLHKSTPIIVYLNVAIHCCKIYSWWQWITLIKFCNESAVM